MESVKKILFGLFLLIATSQSIQAFLGFGTKKN